VLYHTIEFKGERGIAVYVDSETTSEQIYVMESKVESVTNKIKQGQNEEIVVCCVYRSPSSSHEQDKDLIMSVVKETS